MPLTLKIDPWNPAYESALQLDELAGPPETVDATVETSDWSAPPAAVPEPRPETIVFIDGVQRIDIRVIGDNSGQIVYGAFSSLAVGAVLILLGLWAIRAARALHVPIPSALLLQADRVLQ